MRGLVLLFLAISAFGISWRYVPSNCRKTFKTVIRNNLLPVAVAGLAVAAAVFFSINTTLRFV